MVSKGETMKLFKDNLLLAFLIGFLLLVSTIVNAEEDWDRSKYEFRWMHVPVVCGTTPEVQRYLDDNEFELVSMSVGREGANKSGSIAYLVTYYLNKDRTESVSAITSPTGHETCIMYRSFDMKAPGIGT